MINPQWLELPMSRTNFHGPKDVRVIEVRLYDHNRFNTISPSPCHVSEVVILNELRMDGRAFDMQIDRRSNGQTDIQEENIYTPRLCCINV